jgi:hypothetical protein
VKASLEIARSLKIRMRASLFLLIAVGASSPLLAVDDWWQFRGPYGNGPARAIDLPLKWNEKEHVVWMTAIHDRGWSSPVIWRDQVWMTTATGLMEGILPRGTLRLSLTATAYFDSEVCRNGLSTTVLAPHSQRHSQ